MDSFRRGILSLALAAAAAVAAASDEYGLVPGSLASPGATVSTGGGLALTATFGRSLAGAVGGDGLQLRPDASVLIPEYLFRLTLRPHWNLIATPIRPTDPRVAQLLHGVSLGPVWEWADGRYRAATEIQEMRGYWVYCPNAAEVAIRGDAVPDLRAPLSAGWNLIGPVAVAPFDPVLLPPDVEPAGALGAPVFWGWQAETQQAIPAEALLEPGQGYWIYAVEDAFLRCGN